MSVKDMKLTVMGLGYIGLPTATLFAKSGMKVIGYDISEKIVNRINEGNARTTEPGLPEEIEKVVKSGNLRATTNLEESDIFIICVPTPIKEDKSADLSYVEAASKSIKDVLKEGNIVILESTSPPGTTDELILGILEESGLKAGKDFYLAHSPERVLPGQILTELVENARIIGGIDEKSTKLVEEIYAQFVKGELLLTDARTAEMSKLMENTYRDVNIALANELSQLAEKLGVNAWEIIRLANKHPRVNIHQPGPGVGGHCIAIDPWFLVQNQTIGDLIRTSRNINDGRPMKVMEKIDDLVDGKKDAKIAILGLTYKPDVDDIRQSPIIELVEHLTKDRDYEVALHDPFVERDNFEFKDILFDDVYETAKDADILVMGVNHKNYKDLDFDKLLQVMKEKVIYDTRNFFDHKKLRSIGFDVQILGVG